MFGYFTKEARQRRREAKAAKKRARASKYNQQRRVAVESRFNITKADNEAETAHRIKVAELEEVEAEWNRLGC